MGDNTFTTDPTSGSSVVASIECTPDKPVVVEFGDGDRFVSEAGAGAGSVSRARGEGGFAAF